MFYGEFCRFCVCDQICMKIRFWSICEWKVDILKQNSLYTNLLNKYTNIRRASGSSRSIQATDQKWIKMWFNRRSLIEMELWPKQLDIEVDKKCVPLHMISCDIYFEQLTGSKMDTSLFKSDFDLQVRIIKEFHNRLNFWKDNCTWKDKLERTFQLLDFPTTCKPTNYNSIVGESILVSFTMIIWLTFF